LPPKIMRSNASTGISSAMASSFSGVEKN